MQHSIRLLQIGTWSLGNSSVSRAQTRTSNVASVHCRGCLKFFPRAKDQIVSFGIRNLAALTIESVHDFIMTSAISRLAITWYSETTTASSSNNTSTIGDKLPSDNNTTALTTSFLNAHRLESLSFSTTWRWMRLLGLNYDTKKKAFMSMITNVTMWLPIGKILQTLLDRLRALVL